MATRSGPTWILRLPRIGPVVTPISRWELMSAMSRLLSNGGRRSLRGKAASLPTPVSAGSGSAGHGFSQVSTAQARSPGDGAHPRLAGGEVKGGGASGFGRLDAGEQGLDLDLLAFARGELGDGAGERRGQRVLHLHRLEDEQALAGRDLVAFGNVDGDDLAGHRREDVAVVGTAACRAGIARRLEPPGRPLERRPGCAPFAGDERKLSLVVHQRSRKIGNMDVAPVGEPNLRLPSRVQ